MPIIFYALLIDTININAYLHNHELVNLFVKMTVGPRLDQVNLNNLYFSIVNYCLLPISSYKSEIKTQPLTNFFLFIAIF